MAESALSALEQAFRQPALLWLLGVLPLLALFRLWAARRRRRALAALGGGYRLPLVGARGRRLRSACWSLALLLVIVGSAGPQWGRDPTTPPAVGRDILVLLDVSRSMLAEDRDAISRLTRAREQLEDLADTLQRRGGYRVGLIAFAGQAKVLCHLTEDYDSFRFALDQASPERLGAAGRIGYKEESGSYGTSLRRALELAAVSHDPRFQGFQEVLLISDGDDLAGDWQAGAAMMQRVRLPVHTLAVGDPERDSFIPTGRVDEPYVIYEHPQDRTPRKATTRRQDAVLAAVAQRTGGRAMTEEGTPHPLIEWFQADVLSRPVAEWTENRRPIAVQQFAWLFGAALLVLVIEMLLGDGRLMRGSEV